MNLNSKFFLLFLFIFLLFACSGGSSVPEGSVLLTNQGSIFTKPFVNKINRTNNDIQETWLKIGDEHWFIRLDKSDITREWVEDNTGSPFLFTYSLVEGLWDTDDPQVQSRIGTYVVIKKARPVTP